MVPRNPPWERDELILALDLYFHLGQRVPDDTESEVVTLSDLLNKLPLHPSRPDEARFRNPNGVALKLANLYALDHPGHGMSRGGKGDREVWEEFHSDLPRLRRLAQVIREGYANTEVQTPAPSDDEEEEGYPEGRVAYRLHLARERSRKLVEQKKKQVMERKGRLACEVCGFDFAERYGPLSNSFIECHHTIPVSEMRQGAKTKTRDLALVCANCHRMLHRSKELLGLDDLKRKLRVQ